jgi:hypothetical protein
MEALVQLLFEMLVARKIETGKKLIAEKEALLRGVSAADVDAPRLFYVLSGWAEYSALAAEIAKRLKSAYVSQPWPGFSLEAWGFIETGKANLAHYENRDEDVEEHCNWVGENALRFNPAEDVRGTVAFVSGRTEKRCAFYERGLESSRTAIHWYGKACLPGMVATVQATEGWLLMQSGDLQGATQSWTASHEYLKGSEDWTTLGNIRFGQARRLCHAARESEAIAAMQEAINYYFKCAPCHRNLRRVLLELANLQNRMAARASGEHGPARAEELRKNAAANIAQAEELLVADPSDRRNWSRKMLAQLNQLLYGPRPYLFNMRHLAEEAYDFAASKENVNKRDVLMMARARLKQAVVERRAAKYGGCVDPNSVLLRAGEYARDAARLAGGLQNDRLKARIHTLLGNIYLQFPRDEYRATVEWQIAVECMSKHQDDDYLVNNIRALGSQLNQPDLKIVAQPIFLVTEVLAFGQPLDRTIRAVEHAVVQKVRSSLGASASARRISEVLKTGHHRIEKHLPSSPVDHVVDEPRDGEGVIFRVTGGLALTQSLDDIVRAVEYAIVRAAYLRYDCQESTICSILHTGWDRIRDYFPAIAAELDRTERSGAD